MDVHFKSGVQAKFEQMARESGRPATCRRLMEKTEAQRQHPA